MNYSCFIKKRNKIKKIDNITSQNSEYNDI